MDLDCNCGVHKGGDTIMDYKMAILIAAAIDKLTKAVQELQEYLIH